LRVRPKILAWRIGASAQAEVISPRVLAAFAFVGSGCLLVLEIVAGRILAPIIGVSLYTWTSVIGVVLAGVTLGNFLGGRLADRRPTRSTLGLIYLAGAGASLLVLGVVHYASSLQLPGSSPALLQVLWLTGLPFLLPATVLSAATPLLTRLSLRSVEEGGRVAGRIQAAAALGSIAGTFLTGFLLVSWLGTRHIVAGVAFVMLVLAILSRPPWIAGRVLEVGSLAALILVSGWISSSGCTRESSYYCISVKPDFVAIHSGPKTTFVRVKLLYIDGLLHAVVNVTQPNQLVYSYEAEYADVLKQLHPPGSRLEAFAIGGGGYVFPRYLDATYRGRTVVAEIDPAVTDVAERYLGFKPSPRIQIHSEDARRLLASLPRGETFDVVLGDAFNSYEVPYQLTTREFDRLVANHLKPAGIFMENVIDGVHFDFLRSEIRTLRQVFPYVGLIATPGMLPPQNSARETFVIVAAKAPPAARLPTVSAARLDAFMASGRSVLLTDDHVPVDELLAPVFAQSIQAHK
jgi:spermidine synthase